MRPLVVVDDKVAHIKKALADSGYHVQDLSQGWDNASAIVVSGMDENFLGRHDIVARAPVIEATGRDLAQILADVNRIVGLQR
ncbi:MAG: YkuS family protein [Firmicutes bacterium]|nr:YkuS family protein [Bacillota bacterium]